MYDSTKYEVRQLGIHFEGDRIVLWTIRGVPDCYYPTKIATEIMARNMFPNEDVATRYARISFIHFIKEP